MIYPTINEYISALEDAEDNFDKLSSLRLCTDGGGNPIMSSGNYAVVFKMQDSITKDFKAVKCFTREQADRSDSYKKIAEELEFTNSKFLVSFKYFDKELYVDSDSCSDDEFPVIIMDWVDGMTLDAYLRKNRNNKNALYQLAYHFGLLASWLLAQPFAHGDIKPDNILVKQDGRIVLVDYDGMYVPSMKGENAREAGTPGYVHPNRTPEMFNEHIDDFALSIIALSISVYLHDNTIFNPEETLLFSESDYLNLSNNIKIAKIESLLSNTSILNYYSLFLIAYSYGNFPASLNNNFRLPIPMQTEDVCINTDNLILRIDDISFKMIYVEQGETGGISNHSCDHDFYISETVVTKALWSKLMNNNFPKEDDLEPAINLSRNDCLEFIKKLNSITGENFDLPSVDEWMFAAKGGIQSKQYKFAGGNDIDEVAWYNGNSDGHAHLVAQKKPNELGIYDLTGNVAEWCSNRSSNYGEFIVKGGSFGYTPEGCDLSFENSYTPYTRTALSNGTLGCRIILHNLVNKPINNIIKFSME